jgi:hypothetical protein
VHRAHVAVLFGILAAALSQASQADVGIPMLVVAWPIYVLALLPVIAVEAYVGVRKLALPWRRALRVSAIGNVWSTILGIPIVWLALLAVEMAVGAVANFAKLSTAWEYVLFPFMIAWIGGENVWMLYLAFVLLAIPFCLTSIWIERKVALRYLSDLPVESVRAWVRDANVWSYALLVVLAAAYPFVVSRAA